MVERNQSPEPPRAEHRGGGSSKRCSCVCGTEQSGKTHEETRPCCFGDSFASLMPKKNSGKVAPQRGCVFVCYLYLLILIFWRTSGFSVIQSFASFNACTHRMIRSKWLARFCRDAGLGWRVSSIAHTWAWSFDVMKFFKLRPARGRVCGLGANSSWSSWLSKLENVIVTQPCACSSNKAHEHCACRRMERRAAAELGWISHWLGKLEMMQPGRRQHSTLCKSGWQLEVVRR